MDRLDCVVVGAGVVGLAIAREFALRGREVLVLEAASAIGTQTSSRSSEVIHAGIYYRPGSLKSQLCVSGKRLLYAYCDHRAVDIRRCGKLVVATAVEQLAQLSGICANARSNGVVDLAVLTRAQARAMEPELECVAAVHSPSTGIVDSHALMIAFLGDLENAGGVLALNSPLASAQCGPEGIRLTAVDGTELMATVLVNSAGLQAPTLARNIAGLELRHVPQASFAKGSYFSLSGRAPFSRLIYPVPEAAGLGVHMTIDLGGQARFGPDVQWVESASDLDVDPTRGEKFYAEVRRYWPGLPDHSLTPAYAGIRPKIPPSPDGPADFLIQGPSAHGIDGLVNLFGIESPGLTSSLAIAQYVASLCEGHRW